MLKVNYLEKFFVSIVLSSLSLVCFANTKESKTFTKISVASSGASQFSTCGSAEKHAMDAAMGECKASNWDHCTEITSHVVKVWYEGHTTHCRASASAKGYTSVPTSIGTAPSECFAYEEGTFRKRFVVYKTYVRNIPHAPVPSVYKAEPTGRVVAEYKNADDALAYMEYLIKLGDCVPGRLN